MVATAEIARVTRTAVHDLEGLGQSPWLDSISRKMIHSGELQALVEHEGVLGVTSNPTIFAKALATGSEYDADIATLARQGLDDRAIFARLATDDIRDAADVMRPTFDRTAGIDGMVSIELEPDLAHDTLASIARGRELFATIGRPNVMIKVPATEAGLPVVQQLVSEGIPVNVTLLFDRGMYGKVMDSYMAGLEARAAAGESTRVPSVASFFISRVEGAVDGAIAARPGAEKLKGRIAVANAEAAYDAWKGAFSSPRFRALEASGAVPQRPLWASTATKDPAYSDIKYVQELVAPDTVNTMPLDTMRAFADHGESRLAAMDGAGAQRDLAGLADAGVDLDAITAKLQTDGLDSFQKSYDELIAGIRTKREALGV